MANGLSPVIKLPSKSGFVRSQRSNTLVLGIQHDSTRYSSTMRRVGRRQTVLAGIDQCHNSQRSIVTRVGSKKSNILGAWLPPLACLQLVRNLGSHVGHRKGNSLR